LTNLDSRIHYTNNILTLCVAIVQTKLSRLNITKQFNPFFFHGYNKHQITANMSSNTSTVTYNYAIGTTGLSGSLSYSNLTTVPTVVQKAANLHAVHIAGNWTTRTSASDDNWNMVTWSEELSLFVAVSEAGPSVMTSPNGIVWTTRTCPSNYYRGICWSPELSLFVAVAAISGTGHRVMTSPNGINWTTRTSAADNSWQSVIWSPELSLFVAVAQSGTGNRVMTSSNGINWTSRTSPADNSWRSVCWSPELSLFVAVAITGTGNRVMTSPDGINWTTRTSAADNGWL
jgi:hypothetical protein